MAMETVEGQVALGDKLWFIGSPAGSTKCLIIAHGGKLHDNGSFTVPQGVRIRFAGHRGKSLNTSSRTAVLSPTSMKETFGAGATCPDYSLAKFVGHPERMDYVGLRGLQTSRAATDPNDCPHIVSVRSRSFFSAHTKLMDLSEVVRLVIAHEPRIDTVVVNACRGESDSVLTLMKAAVFGV
jgi:hypothetical protein